MAKQERFDRDKLAAGLRKIALTVMRSTGMSARTVAITFRQVAKEIEK